MGAYAMRHVCAGLAFAVLAAGNAAAQSTVSLSLDTRAWGPMAPFFVALDKGYYTAQKLDVSIELLAGGSGTAETIKRVAAGTDAVGFADINALIRYRDQNPGAPIKVVFMVYNQPPYAVVSRKSRGVTTPKDLEGKRLGAPNREGSAAQWPLFAKLAGIDAAKVTVENISLPVRDPMLAAGQVDAVTGYSFSVVADLKDRGVPQNDLIVFPMKDYGLELYGGAIVVNEKFAAANPDVVKAFLRAYVRALKETIKSPSVAIESIVRRNETARKDVELERLTMAIRDNIMTPEVKANGFGGIDAARFDRSMEQMALAYKFRNGKPKLEDVFDASFLPPAAERKAN
jgi:NitT/TauT family transport system substrate-binding protein